MQAEQSLCKIYRQSYDNQKIDLNSNTPIKMFDARIKNLKRQFPEDIENMCERWGI